MYCFSCRNDSSESGICTVCGKPFTADPDQYFKAGMEALAAGEVNRSVALLRECVNLNPDHLNARYNLGTALAMDDRNNEALEQYLAVVQKESDYPGIYTALGQVAFGSYLSLVQQAEEQGRAMIRLFMKAIEEDPEDVDAHFSIANAYIALEDPVEALPHLEHALILQPDSSAVLYTMAKAFMMLGRYSEATLMATRSMRAASPDDPFWEDIQSLLSELRQAARHA